MTELREFDGVAFEAVEESGRKSLLKQIQDELSPVHVSSHAGTKKGDSERPGHQGEAELGQFLTPLSLNPKPPKTTATEALRRCRSCPSPAEVNSRKPRAGTGEELNQS